MLRTVFFVLFFLSVELLLNPTASGQTNSSLYLGAGEPGSESFVLGVGVTSLIKVKLLPSDGIDLTLVENSNGSVVADLLIVDQKKMAGFTEWEPATRSRPADLRSVMAINRNNDGAGPSLEMIARSDVPERAIYSITKAILENGVFFEGLNQRTWDLSVDKALIGLTLPLHAGAARYYEEIGEANLSAHLALKTEPAPTDQAEVHEPDSTFFLDFGVDATTLDRHAKRQIAEACQFATVFEATKIEVTGYAGDQVSDRNLVKERERYVVEALRSNVRCAEHVDIVLADRTLTSAGATRPGKDSDRIEVIIRFVP